MLRALVALLIVLALAATGCAAPWTNTPGGAASTVNDSDLVLISQGGTSRTATRAQFVGANLPGFGNMSAAGGQASSTTYGRTIYLQGATLDTSGGKAVVKIAPGAWVTDTDYATLSLAATAATTFNRALHITKQWSVTTNTDLSGVPELDVLAGGSFAVSAGTLTLPANFHAASLVQCFYMSGTGVLSGLLRSTPQMFGAKGDGVASDAAPLQAAVSAVRALRGTVEIPNGTYKISSTVDLSDGTLPPPNIRGESGRGVILLSTLTGTNPVLRDLRSSMTYPSMPILENFTIKANTDYTGVGVQVSGAIDTTYRNLFLNRLKYGLYLYDNAGPNTWTEANKFENIWAEYCNSAVRLEQGNGNGSFHGNAFVNVRANIGANQIGFDHVSGYFYNGRIDLLLWATVNSAILVNAHGNAEFNVGNITVEILAPGANQARITGSSTGRFWYTGAFNYMGGTITDQAGLNLDGAPIFSANNYRTTTTMSDSHISAFTPAISTYNPNGIYNGRGNYTLWQMNAPGVTSFLLDGFGGGSLYTGNSTYNNSVESAAVGWGMNLDGSALTSYNANGGCFLTGASQYAACMKAGEFYVGSPDRKMKIVPGLGDPNNNITGDPGNLVLTNYLGTGSLYVKESGDGTNTGWAKVATSSGGVSGNATTLNGFTASQTPVAGQIPVLKSTGSIVIPNNIVAQGTQFQLGNGFDSSTTGTVVFSQTIDLTSNRDVLLAYNDYFSGTMTVTYTGPGRFCVKSFTFTGSNNHTPTVNDYTKLRSFYAVTNSFGVPYVKLTTDGNATPHLYIPLVNTVAGGRLTVTFTSDIGHHPFFLPVSAAGTLGAATTLTGL